MFSYVFPEIAIITAAAAALGALVIAALALARPAWARIRVTPAGATWALAALFLAVCLAVTLGRHYAMATCGFDMGYYGNVIWQFGHGHPFASAVTSIPKYFNHCSPLLIVLAPFAYIFKEPGYLLVLQALAAAAGIPLLYALARPADEGASRWPAFLLALGFALSPILHDALIYDFHPRVFGIPLALGAFYFFRARRFKPAAILVVALALTEDEFALHAVALAAWGAFASGKRRAGLWLAAGVAVYFIAFPLILYPRLTYARGNVPIHYATYFQTLPATFETTIRGYKIAYLAILALPIALPAAAAGGALVTLVTPLAIPLLASTATVYQVGWQYALAWLPFLYGAGALGLSRLPRARMKAGRRTWVAFICALAVLAPIVLMYLWRNDLYRTIAKTAVPTPYTRVLARTARLVPAEVPFLGDDPFVAHLCHRRYAWVYTPGIIDNLPARPRALVLDRRRHPLGHFRRVTEDAATLGLRLKAVNEDAAYFAADGKLPNSELFRRWYQTMEEWQGESWENRIRYGDSRAHNGRALEIPRHMRLEPGGESMFPPGRYRFVYRLRPKEADHCVQVVVKARLVDPKAGITTGYKEKSFAVGPAADYGSYKIELRSKRPFFLYLDLYTYEPVFFDTVSINSDDYKAETLSPPRR